MASAPPPAPQQHQLCSNWEGQLPAACDLAAAPPVVSQPHQLRKPSDAAGPCTITLTHPQQQQQQLVLVSNARMVEVSVQQPAAAGLSYLQTVRCEPAGDSRWRGAIDLQGAAGCSSVQLKLLSLQGPDKTVCNIYQLQLLPAEQAAAAAADTPQHQAQPQTHEGQQAAEPAATSSQHQQQQPVSQLDELRLLIQQLHNPGPAGASAEAVPESLRLLHSKATEAPQPGAGTAIKNLSAHIAQGMLAQAAQQRAQQQQQGLDAASLSQPVVVSATAPLAGPAQQQGLQDVLAVLQRLEAKVDRLAEGVQTGLQQLDSRLRQLEAAASAACN